MYKMIVTMLTIINLIYQRDGYIAFSFACITTSLIVHVFFNTLIASCSLVPNAFTFIRKYKIELLNLFTIEYLTK